MTFTKLILALASVMSSAMAAQEAKVTRLLSKDLTNLPGKEGLMLQFGYHTSPQCIWVHLCGGRIVMQVRGGQETTLTPGQTFYVGPDDVHVVGRNASQTNPAKFVVFFIKDKGAPILVPDN